MGRNSGGSGRGGWTAVGTSTLPVLTVTGKGTVKTAPTSQNSIAIADMKNKDTAKSLMKAVNKVYKELGLGTANIRLANLSGAYGATYFVGGKVESILLDQKFFDRKKSVVAEQYEKNNYTVRQNGLRFKNVTSSPVQHTITHEIGHSLWSSYKNDPASKAMDKEIRQLYREYRKDKYFKNKGEYSMSNVDEFVAETIATAIHPQRNRYGGKGWRDYYGTKLVAIMKKHLNK